MILWTAFEAMPDESRGLQHVEPFRKFAWLLDAIVNDIVFKTILLAHEQYSVGMSICAKAGSPAVSEEAASSAAASSSSCAVPKRGFSSAQGSKHSKEESRADSVAAQK